MIENELIESITNLIKSGKEGEYWDFKEMKGASLDMIHDIICLANNPNHFGERYLIYGVKENSKTDNNQDKYSIVGIDQNIIIQSNIIDSLRSCGFSGGFFPDIRLENITLIDKNLSIIVISDKPNLRPYTLSKIRAEGKIKLYPGAIYTRTQDTNTPKDQTADLAVCEKIWQQRFGIDKSIFERFKSLLLEPQNWTTSQKSNNSKSNKNSGHTSFPVYHKIYPEFQIEQFPPEKRGGEIFCYLYICAESNWGQIYLKYHNAEIGRIGYVYCDNFNVFLPIPKIFKFDKEQSDNLDLFYYIIRNDLEGYFLKFINGYKHACENKAIFLFENSLELDDFVSNAKREFNYKNLPHIDSMADVHDIVKNSPEIQEQLNFQLNLREFYDQWKVRNEFAI